MNVSIGRQTTSVRLTGAHIRKNAQLQQGFFFSLDMPLTFITAVTVFTALILKDKLEMGLIFFIKLSIMSCLSSFFLTLYIQHILTATTTVICHNI